MIVSEISRRSVNNFSKNEEFIGRKLAVSECLYDVHSLPSRIIVPLYNVVLLYFSKLLKKYLEIKAEITSPTSCLIYSTAICIIGKITEN